MFQPHTFRYLVQTTSTKIICLNPTVYLVRLQQVVAQRKDGSSFAINLCVSENKAPNHHTFCGTLQEIATANEDGRNSTVNPYALLESILDTTIVINDKGIVQFFNAQVIIHRHYSFTFQTFHTMIAEPVN
jgi:hypothetical protein